MRRPLPWVASSLTASSLTSSRSGPRATQPHFRTRGGEAATSTIWRGTATVAGAAAWPVGGSHHTRPPSTAVQLAEHDGVMASTAASRLRFERSDAAAAWGAAPGAHVSGMCRASRYRGDSCPPGPGPPAPAACHQRHRSGRRPGGRRKNIRCGRTAARCPGTPGPPGSARPRHQ